MWLSDIMHGKKISKLFWRSLFSYTCVFFLPILAKLAAGSPVCYAREKNSFLTVALPLLSATDGEALSILCVQIDKKGLQDILESRLLPEYPCAFLLADADSVLLSAQSMGFAAADLPIREIHAFFSENTHKNYFRTADMQQIADSYPLWISGTSLIFAAQRSGYQTQLNHVLLLMLLSLLVCILLGILVIMYLSRKNYEPISQIMRYIRRNEEAFEAESNEYRLIMKVLDKNRAGISGIVHREQIPDAWLQADTALEYGKLFETGMLCAYDTVPTKQTIGSLSLNTSEYVIHMVTQGQQTQITEYFDTLQKELKKNELSWADAKSCYYFFYHVTASLQLYCQTHYGIRPQALEFLDEAYFAQSLPSAFLQIREAYLQTCEEIVQKGRSAVQWGHNICRFIDNNYFDANLNLNSIASHFQITPSYLSKKFREQYQTGVVDYLYEIRIANSLPLLKKTDLKIADIARMTGFVDSNAFIRIFKKLKGVTPGRFRDQD